MKPTSGQPGRTVCVEPRTALSGSASVKLMKILRRLNSVPVPPASVITATSAR